MERALKIAIMGSGQTDAPDDAGSWADVAAAAMHDRGLDVTLFKGAGSQDRSYERVVPCANRRGRWASRIANWTPGFAWHVGCGSAYDVEQTTFAIRVLPHLRRGRFDVIHLQDPWLALLLERARRFHGAKVILGHATDEPAWFLRKLSHVQEPSPYFLQQHGGLDDRKWFAIPDFVNADRFRSGDQRAARDRFGLPHDKLVVLCVAALDRSQNRLHWLAYEFLRAELENALLVIAGAEQSETQALLSEIEPLLERQLVVVRNIADAQLPSVYQAGDVYVTCSLREMMSVSTRRAMATGLPCVVHNRSSSAWAIGDGGLAVNMKSPDALADALAIYEEDPALREAHGVLARRRVEELFSIDAVTSQFVAMYRSVLGIEEPRPDGTVRRFDPPTVSAR